MRCTKILALFVLSLTLFSCGNGKDLNKRFKLILNAENATLKTGETLQISLQPDKNSVLDSVVYRLEGNLVGRKNDVSAIDVQVNPKQLGRKKLTATLFAEGKTDTISKFITVLSDKSPQLYGYEVIKTYPHDTSSYTQGLEFHDGTLYESAGEYGKSALLKVDYKTGNIEKEIKLADKYFAEGLTIINDRLIQLTWQEDEGFIYDLDTFEKEGSFTYGESKQGWGLCNDGKTIYKSDGSTKIWLLDPQNLTETGHIEVVDNKALRSKYNELEWVNGKIYGNTYQNDGISVINPETGAIEAVIDLRPLKELVQGGLDKNNEVLNGIAYNPDSKTLFVTGKHWNTLFEIKVVKK
ncbi:MAG TPA: glutaminyl-peptide cyclotransferase [Leeuwenhoekiella sp.]|nr:glutaminyl-peptide cyclotransferase [Leeuwenhoekiella sp.]